MGKGSQHSNGRFLKFDKYIGDFEGEGSDVTTKVELSKRSVIGDSYPNGHYGVKLVDKFDDVARNEPESSDNDSIFDEFISHEL